MNKRFPVVIIPILIIFIAIANATADYWHLYFYIWWLDIPMHILGGFWVALTSLVFYYAFPEGKEKERSVIFVYALAIASVLTIGLMWEIYEFSVDSMFSLALNQVGDTLKDLSDDFVGGVIGATLFIWRGYNKKI
jgi:hypothetical protein